VSLRGLSLFGFLVSAFCEQLLVRSRGCPVAVVSIHKAMATSRLGGHLKTGQQNRSKSIYTLGWVAQARCVRKRTRRAYTDLTWAEDTATRRLPTATMSRGSPVHAGPLKAGPDQHFASGFHNAGQSAQDLGMKSRVSHAGAIANEFSACPLVRATNFSATISTSATLGIVETSGASSKASAKKKLTDRSTAGCRNGQTAVSTTGA